MKSENITAMLKLNLTTHTAEELNAKHGTRQPLAYTMAAQGIELPEACYAAVGTRGDTVAHRMAEHGFQFKNLEHLKLRAVDGETVAHEMARQSTIFTEEEILLLADDNGWTVAHEQASFWEEGEELPSKNILKVANAGGWTVAHEYAEQGYDFTDLDILKLAGVKKQVSVAHVMAERGYMFDENSDIVHLKTNAGRTVLRCMVEHGFIPKDVNAIMEVNSKGKTLCQHLFQKHGLMPIHYGITDIKVLKATYGYRTFAHALAEAGIAFDDPEVLKLSTNRSGWTVAHEMAKFGHLIVDEEILNLETRTGVRSFGEGRVTVREVMANYNLRMRGRDIGGLAIIAKNLTK